MNNSNGIFFYLEVPNLFPPNLECWIGGVINSRSLKEVLQIIFL
ncbi:hypothetical protein GXM_06585 [Nostoc sphaeroides CCNUC1]|uniref:Uncharacterized protein n=1 Tax=Nostoc sphaeroides CCNUC1 TaxID=2653204 RepID=A0A5P8W978_9NOSO|nr:hypothetical protein GXM_06585 [Nostoc sphaeroides CCNUC1]